MSQEEVYLTREGYNKLREKLEYFKTSRRKELSLAIEQARAFGDLRENAEYDAAKEAQAMNEKDIGDLEDKLSRVRILDDENISKDEIRIGAKVTLKDIDTEEEIQYTLVAEVEADYSQGKISVVSPVGKSLLGHKENEVVEIKIPAGILKYKIIKIER